MTLIFMTLAIGSCLGWTLHARMLRRALYKAWAEIDALDNRSTFTHDDYQRERSDLEQRFLAAHGTHADDIDIAIHRGVLPCNDPLVEEWIELDANPESGTSRLIRSSKIFARDTQAMTTNQLTRRLNTHVGDPNGRFSIRDVRATAKPPAGWPVVHYSPRYLQLPRSSCDPT